MRIGVMILLSLLAALVLALIPMPEWTVWLRPAWMLMMLIYWSIITPYYVGVGIAWLLGLMMDLLSGTLLGQQAMTYAIIIYLVSRIHIRLRMFPLLQQSLSVLIFTFLAQFILFCIQGFIGGLPVSPLYWLAPLISALLWPWLYIFMRTLCRRFKMA